MDIKQGRDWALIANPWRPAVCERNRPVEFIPHSGAVLLKTEDGSTLEMIFDHAYVVIHPGTLT